MCGFVSQICTVHSNECRYVCVQERQIHTEKLTLCGKHTNRKHIMVQPNLFEQTI